MRRRGVTALAAVSLVARLATAAEPTPSAHAIAVVVGPASAVRSVTKDVLREIYLRRQRVWQDGTRVIPVNLPVTSPVRETFARLVLGRSTQDTVAYWNARYFEGITPPQVLPSARAIRGFLEAEPGAIAYLPIGDVDDKTCRTVVILEPGNDTSTTEEDPARK